MINRNWRILSLSSLGALVVFAIACGDDASTVTAPPPALTDASTDDVVQVDASLETTEVEAFCAGTLGLYGPRFESCCNRADAPKQYMFDTTLLKAASIECSGALGKSLEAARVEFVAPAAATCKASVSAAVDARTCPDVLRTPSNQPTKSTFGDGAGCSGVVVGRVGVDGACSNDYECLDGLTCLGWTPKGDGVCKTPPGEGAPCGYAIPDGGGVIELLRFGFGTHPRCAAGFYCASTALQQGTCRASKPAEGTCNSNDECAEGLRCQLGVCGTAGPAPVDAPCKRSSDCQDRLYCKSIGGSSVCAVREIAGAPCSGALGSECQGACVEADGGGASCVAFCGSP